MKIHQIASWLLVIAFLIITYSLVSFDILDIEDASVGLNVSLADAPCVATDAASFGQCISGVNNGTVNAVEVANQISCGAATPCEFLIWNVHRPIDIYGRPNSGAGFFRTDTANTILLHIAASDSITVRDLLIDENINIPCTPATDQSCQSTIRVADSSNITIDKVAVYNAKRAAIDVYAVPGIRITNSKFINGYLFGVALGNDVHGSYFANNLVTESKANGLVFYRALATVAEPSVVRDNVFIHNHDEKPYHLCGPGGNEPCSGGQILVSQYSTNVLIDHNVIKGTNDDSTLQEENGGIEIDSLDVSNVTIQSNDIHNHTMWGVYINPNPTPATGGIQINNNKFYLNGQYQNPDYNDVDIGNFPPGSNIMTQSGNCFGAACAPVAQLGAIYANPNPCVNLSGSTCSSQLIWNINDATAPIVQKNGVTAYSTAYGSTSVTTDSVGNTYNLLNSGTLLDYVFHQKIPLPPPPDTTPPLISAITSSSITQTTATISWTTNEASDTQVIFSAPCPTAGCSTTLVTTPVTNHSVNISGLNASTTYTYQVNSRDAAGNLATSANQNFTTQTPPPTLPTVSITSPANNSQVQKNKNITITAGVNAVVIKVEFYVNNVLTCTDTSTPFSCVWKVPNVSNVVYTLNAKAFNAANNSATSANVTVTSK